MEIKIQSYYFENNITKIILDEPFKDNVILLFRLFYMF